MLTVLVELEKDLKLYCILHSAFSSQIPTSSMNFVSATAEIHPNTTF
jgi:hypothetical protein